MTIPMKSGLPAAAFVALCLVSPPASAAEQTSHYTRHDFSRCAAKTSPEPGVIEVRACKGLSGIPVVWTGEPDSSSVAFGRATDADDPIPGLGQFYEPRATVEWRGPMLGGQVRPIAAILRYDTGRAVGSLNASRIVVHRLMPDGVSCVMGVVAGSVPNANVAARAMVDRSASDFVCGRSRVIGGS